ncbi:NmrA-like negative transcriptional regulator family protein [Actinidia rufa]|uniref:NmrA-like negative transcriptional regulator family protein n=1 Tax=Actinidia rufa TaxID=165716 RepID=A0A7J0F8S3_9ERIC|nr:NmrA-like negative transcriptional regulator family protein [Actinidia rufa]
MRMASGVVLRTAFRRSSDRNSARPGACLDEPTVMSLDRLQFSMYWDALTAVRGVSQRKLRHANHCLSLMCLGIPAELAIERQPDIGAYPNSARAGLKTPPRDKVMIFGDGNVKVQQTIHAHWIRQSTGGPQVVGIWESKIGKKLEKIYVPEKELFKKIEAGSLQTRDMLAYRTADAKGMPV